MVELTVLNSMASSDFVEALDRHLQWGLKVLDLKDLVFDKRIVDLTLDEAERARELMLERELSVYCFSTHLFGPTWSSVRRCFARTTSGK